MWNNNNLLLFYPYFPYFEFPSTPPLANSVLQSVAAQLWIKKGGGILSRWSELWTSILLFNIMLSDRQDNGRVGDWHKHEDKRVGCYTGNSLWWIMTTLQNMFFLFFHLRLYDSFLLLWGSLTSKIKNEVNDSSIIRCLHACNWVHLNVFWCYYLFKESGKKLTPLCGPGYTGLKNLGNR